MSRFTYNRWFNMFLQGEQLPARLRDRMISEAFQELPEPFKEPLISNDRNKTTEEDRNLWLGFLLYTADYGKLFSEADIEAEDRAEEARAKFSLIKGINKNKGAIDMSIDETISDYMVTLSKPYTFESETYTKLDLQGMEDLTTKDLREIENIYMANGGNPALTGLTLEYAIIVASRVAHKPLEFFDDLPAKDATALKNEVVAFFFE